MEVKRFVCNMIRENTYVVSDDTREAVIIDCGAFYDMEKAAIKQYIDDNQLVPKHLVATHGHVDHHLGDRFVFDTWGLKPEVAGGDEDLMERLPEQAKEICGEQLTADDFAPVGRYLTPADTIDFGHSRLTLIDALATLRRHGILQRGRQGAVYRRHAVPWRHRPYRPRGRFDVPHHPEPAHALAIAR